MAKLTKDEIQRAALSSVLASPAGVRYSDLLRLIVEANPETPANSIRGALHQFEARFSDQIEKPARGVYAPRMRSDSATASSDVAPAVAPFEPNEFAAESDADEPTSEAHADAAVGRRAPRTRGATEFEDRLHALVERRLDWMLRTLGVARRGAPMKMNGRIKDREVAELIGEATRVAIDNFARSAFNAASSGKKGPWRLTPDKGRGPDARRASFAAWYGDNIGAKASCVYVFWKDADHCVYVGRTQNGHGRPSDHFSRIWAQPTSWIDIYVPATPKRDLAKLECLAMHLFDPSRNKAKAANKRYRAECPVCAAVIAVEAELRSLFRLK